MDAKYPDQYRRHETELDRQRQDEIMRAFCSAYGYIAIREPDLSPWDYRVFKTLFELAGYAEVKWRSNAQTKYDDYIIDCFKIDHLLDAATNCRLKACLIVCWQREIFWLILRSAQNFPKEFVTRKAGGRQEKGDWVYHIDYRLFHAL